ncbi:BrnT family toxin [Patescibacteria group bacterium]|nr:BrnT family toxin [Patescibacteria group bacterium]MBU1885199.1 BrnT family toxin [Patescibacteria group bacterium]
MTQIPDLSKLKKFEWDDGNSTKNYKKHQVTQTEAEEIFKNKPLLTISDQKHSQHEKRYRSLGQTNNDKKLLIIFTIRKKKIRIISVRLQSKKERIIYEQA